MMFSIRLIIIFGIIIQEGKSAFEEKKFIMRNTRQPGILFENKYDVKFINDYWILSCHIDTVWEKYRITSLERQLKDLHTNYQKFYQDHLYEYHDILQQFNETYQIFDAIDRDVKQSKGNMSDKNIDYYMVQSDAITPTERLRTLKYTKRIFFESTVSRETDEEKRTWQEVNQTIEEVYQELRKNWKKNITNLLNNIIRYLRTILKKKLDRGRNILEAIESIKRGDLTKQLLQEKDLQDVKEAIENYKGDEIFPYDNIESFTHFATLEFGIRERKIMTNIQIPVMRKQSTTIFLMSPLPAPQMQNIILSIQPVAKYILVNSQGFHYLAEKELERCEKFKNVIVCKNEWFNYQNDITCEYGLLINNREMKYENCQIICRRQKASFLYKTISERSWIFSTSKVENAIIKCDNKEISLQVNKVGIIAFNNTCTLMINNDELRLDKEADDLKFGFIIPDINLYINNLTTFNNFSFIKEEPKYFWEEMRNIQQESDKKKSIHTLHYVVGILMGIILMTIIVTLIIVGFLWYVKRMVENTPNEIELNVQTETGSTTPAINQRALLKFL